MCALCKWIFLSERRTVGYWFGKKGVICLCIIILSVECSRISLQLLWIFSSSKICSQHCEKYLGNRLAEITELIQRASFHVFDGQSITSIVFFCGWKKQFLSVQEGEGLLHNFRCFLYMACSMGVQFIPLFSVGMFLSIYADLLILITDKLSVLCSLFLYFARNQCTEQTPPSPCSLAYCSGAQWLPEKKSPTQFSIGPSWIPH